jgi:predicted phage terminase large subunit-like protein
MTDLQPCTQCKKPALPTMVDARGWCAACQFIEKSEQEPPPPPPTDAVAQYLGRRQFEHAVNEALDPTGHKTAQLLQEFIESPELQAEAAATEAATHAATHAALNPISDPLPDAPVPKLFEAEMARRVLAKRHMLPFVMRFKPDYKAGWVHKEVCAALEKFSRDVAEGKSPRLMIFLPPRSGKSELISVNFPAWHLANYPQHEFISASHTAGLAVTFSRRVRAILRDPAYHSITKTRLSDDSQSSELWRTTQGGGLAAVGVGSAVVGKGAHVLAIDDPVAGAEEAESGKTRQAILEWYQTEAFTRLAPGGGVLILMQRWHDDDLAGHLEKHGKETGYPWTVIKFPAEAVEDERFRKKGEALHPERYPLELLHQIKANMTPRQWEALYQQNPIPDEGAYFQRGWFRYQPLPSADQLTYYDTWDLAIGEKETNDYTVGLSFALDREENLYLIEMQRGRWDALEIANRIIDTHLRRKSLMVGVEKGHISMTLGPLLEQILRERKVYSLVIDGNLIPLTVGRRDKEARARAIQGRMQQGRVHFPTGASWLMTVENELLRFPSGEHDDIVDAMAWIGLMLQDLQIAHLKKTPPKKSWKDNLHKYLRTDSTTRSTMCD